MEKRTLSHLADAIAPPCTPIFGSDLGSHAQGNTQAATGAAGEEAGLPRVSRARIISRTRELVALRGVPRPAPARAGDDARALRQTHARAREGAVLARESGGWIDACL